MSGDTSNIPGLDSILRGEILRKDALISQLANQNKELMAAKERQEIECVEQRETLQVAAPYKIHTYMISQLIQHTYLSCSRVNLLIKIYIFGFFRYVLKTIFKIMFKARLLRT